MVYNHESVQATWLDTMSRALIVSYGFLLALLHCVKAQWPQGNDDDDPVTTQDVEAIQGRSVGMPCDIDPPDPNDRVHMVLWFREKGTKPLYSFDVRGRSFGKALYWSDENAFGTRAYFQTVSRPAALALDGVSIHDEGIYRCRVDFRNSPTRNYQVNLTVIVPPQKILLTDHQGAPISDVIGPLNEGADLILRCEVRGGKPTPTVSWLANDKLTAGSVDYQKSGVVTAKLQVSSVSRNMLNSTYKCQASNSKLILPLERTATLELYLKPRSARILVKPKQLQANSEYLIPCEAEGSRPLAEIVWWRDNKRIKRAKISTSSNSTVVTSTLHFLPTAADHGTALKCSASTPNISGSTVEDFFVLDVVYAPQVTLQLGNTLRAEDIKEGGDVYFECIIRANPKEHKITWFHDGQLVTHNISSGVILSTSSLVLQGVTRHDSGNYACLAGNTQGETMSKPVMLRVQYAPVCSTTEVIVVGASLDEAVRVRCHVTADPSDVSFLWQFNNSGDNFEVPPTRFGTANGSSSELMYTPTIERDYGTLACWGKNAIGRQTEPCIFQVVPAARPGPLRNCTIRTTNTSQDVFDVDCLAGYDGGLTQHFVLEAYESRTMRLRLNLTTDVPIFRVDLSELLPTSAYTPVLHLVIFAVNSKGRGDPYILEDIALHDAEKRTESVLGSTAGLSAVPMAALFCGIGLVIGLTVLLVIVVIARRRRPAMHTPSTKLKSSLVEINDGDRRYVVSYTLKSPADCLPDMHEKQPDILSTPGGGNAFADSPKRPSNLFSMPGEGLVNQDCCDIPKPCSVKDPMANVSLVQRNSPLNSPRSDGTLRKTREGIIPRCSPTTLPRHGATLTKHKPQANGDLPPSIGAIPGPESCV